MQKKKKKAANQSRIKLVRKFEVEELRLTADWNVSTVVTFPMWSGSVFRTEGPNERMYSHLPSCPCKMGVAGDGGRH